MGEKGQSEMLFAPKEQMLASAPEDKPASKLELSIKRVSEATKRLLHISESQLEEKKRRNSTSIGVHSRSEPAIVDLKHIESKKIEVAVEMPKSILSDARKDFAAAFPKYQDQFDETSIQYFLGFKDISDEDLNNFMELLNEKGTLMGEAYPFYELLTQKMSEKAAGARGGLRGKLLKFLSQTFGWFSYRLDIPVARQWSNIERKLTHMYGVDRKNELIEDLYFGEKNGYDTFVKSCEAIEINFTEIAEKAKKESWYTGTLNERIKANPKILRSPIVAGGLNLPGKIHDVLVPVVAGLTISASGLIGIMAKLAGESIGSLETNIAMSSMMLLAGIAIPAGGIGVIYHEMTHILGGNFRRMLKKVTAR